MAGGVDGALRRDKGLTNDLTAKNTLPGRLRAATTKQIVFQCLKIEYGE